MRAIQISEFGGPEVLVLREVKQPTPEGKEIMIDVEAAGVNWGDTHQAEDSYATPSPLEVVGTTSDGRRVVALLPDRGGYAEKAASVERHIHQIPDQMDAHAALAVVLQGATAWHLLRTATHMVDGEKVLVHAGAGGVGSLAIQLAKRWGASTVVATASSEDKRQICRDLGADAAIDSTEAKLTEAILDAAGGPVNVVLEMSGGQVTEQSLRALAPLGRLAFYGMASRKPPAPVDLVTLLQHGHTVVGFWLQHVFGRSGLNRGPVQELLDYVDQGELKTLHGGTYPLSEARRAHEDIRSRSTTGKLTIDPRL